MEHNPFGRRQVRATEETVGVVGKQFPSTFQSDFYSRCPTLVMIISVIFPVAFMFVGIGSDIAVDVSLDGFVADPHESTTSASIVASAVSSWTDALTGTSAIRSKVDTSRSRSNVEFRQEIRFDIKLPEFSNWYYGTYLPGRTNPESFAVVSNMLRQENLELVKRAEQLIRGQYLYERLCFTNNLKYGEVGTSSPECVPMTSMTQYFYPGEFSVISNGRVDWPFSGQGLYYQYPYQNVMNRVLANNNYRWFVDKRMSNLYPYTRSLRTQITLATPFTTSKSQSSLAAVRSFVKGVKSVLSYLSGQHAYIYFSFGGDQVEDALVDDALQKEYYKLGVMILIVAVVAWIHTRTVILTICMVAQLLLTYLASWGFYISVFDTSTNNVASASQDDEAHRALPLLSSISLFLIISFCLHGTLTFYDTFVHSGIMATTGRRNNLSVSQRIAFTMRRASFGITIANIVAIIVFAINASSAFQAVRDFSVMMIFSLLFNMYFAWTTTPAYILWHHYYFSRKRRVAQKQREVVSEHADEVRRNPAMRELLQQIQMHLRPEEESYLSMATKESVLQEAEEAKWKAFLRQGAGALVTDTKRELDEVIASIRQNRETSARRGGGGALNGSAIGGTTTAEEFQFEMFVDVNAQQENTCDHFYSDRLVLANRMLHIPLHATLRAADNVALAMQAATQASSAANGEEQQQQDGRRPRNLSVSEIEAGRGRTTSDAFVPPIPPQMTDAELASFWSRWEESTRGLSIACVADGAVHPLLPLIAYNYCAAHDPRWVVSQANEMFHHGRGGPPGTHPRQVASFAERQCSDDGPIEMTDLNDQQRQADGTASGHQPLSNNTIQQRRPPTSQSQGRRSQRVGNAQIQPQEEFNNVFSKMRHRWKVRESQERQYCCGMLGKRVNESREERDARILARATKKEGYGRMERALTQFVAPWIDAWKYILLATFGVLFIVAIVLSTGAKPAGVPKTLLVDVSESTTFAYMGNLFAQSGTCDFCGLYYRPYNTPAGATERDLIICVNQGPSYFRQQMNVRMDNCDICNGDNACIRCNGQTTGSSVITSCGTCATSSAACTQCLSTASCSYCKLRNLTAQDNYGGPSCGTQCTCTAGRGTCNAFTGKCDCKRTSTSAFGGSECEGCAESYIEAGCEGECTATQSSPACNCDVTTSQCQSCPFGKRGMSCTTDVIPCVHGAQNAAASGCDCDAGYEDGELCTRHVWCTYRGVLYNSTSAPMDGCGCVGNWAGQNCTACRCINGGTCMENGTCACVGAFYGDQCQHCPWSCSKYGACPAPLSPALMNFRSCLGTCSFADQDAGIVCSPCDSVLWTTTASCTAHITPLACNTDVACLWFQGQCFSNANPSPVTAAASTVCECKGAWSGKYCDVCNGPNGSTCLYNGNIKACDGFTYSSSGGAPAVDKCGVCGGSGNCIGCDGVPNSGKVFDECGVCGGNNGCLGTTAASSISVTFFVNVAAYGTLPAELLDALSALCQTIQGHASAGVMIAPVTCVISDYITWQTQGAGYTTTNTTQYDIHRLYTYALAAGGIGNLGFSETNATSTSLRLVYSSVTVNLPTLTTAPNDVIYQRYETMLSIASSLQASMAASGFSHAEVRQTSPSWANAVAAHVSLVTLRFTTGVGMAMAFCIMGSVFCNIRLSLFATLGVVFVLCATLGTASIQGWDIDAVTQICVAGVLAVAVEHLVHVIDGYQDFLQTTQTHMFSITTTKMHAFRGSLTRTGVSILSSTVATIAVALLFVTSAVQPFRRAAQVMITVHLLTLLTAVFFGAALCAAGPTILIRHWAASTVLCLNCAVCGGIAVLIIFLAGGVEGPSGNFVP